MSGRWGWRSRVAGQGRAGPAGRAAPQPSPEQADSRALPSAGARFYRPSGRRDGRRGPAAHGQAARGWWAARLPAARSAAHMHTGCRRKGQCKGHPPHLTPRRSCCLPPSIAPPPPRPAPPRPAPPRPAQRGYKVRALSRSPEKVRSLLGDAPGLEPVIADLRDPASLPAALEGVDAVCCCTGTTAFPSKRWVGWQSVAQRMRGWLLRCRRQGAGAPHGTAWPLRCRPAGCRGAAGHDMAAALRCAHSSTCGGPAGACAPAPCFHSIAQAQTRVHAHGFPRPGGTAATGRSRPTLCR